MIDTLFSAKISDSRKKNSPWMFNSKASIPDVHCIDSVDIALCLQ